MAEIVGKYWTANLDVVKINGKFYVLDDNHWNGEHWSRCWEVTGEVNGYFFDNVDSEDVEISPVYDCVDGDYEIVDYVII